MILHASDDKLKDGIFSIAIEVRLVTVRVGNLAENEWLKLNLLLLA
jgi:hypothetical protein